MTKYLITALIIICIGSIGYSLTLKHQRNTAREKLDTVTKQLDQVLQANASLKGTIDLLQQQAEQNNKYIIDLEQRKQQTQANATQAENKFKDAKQANQSINVWANGKLPNGLY